GSFNDFFTAVINSQRISDYEKRTVTRINDDKNQIQVEVANRTAEEQQKQAAKARKDAELAQLASAKAAQQDALAYLAQLQAQALQAEQQAEAAVQALQSAINALTLQRNKLGSGRLVWPNDGPISQGFGCNTYWFEPYDSRFCHYPLHFHNGLDIAGPCWSNVVAADSGIAYPQPFMSYGYGNWILVDHGAGMVTLYGHLNQYSVGYRKFVNRGQVIGYEGSTGNSTGCHVHFSVFINNGTWPVNPLTYLPPR